MRPGHGWSLSAAIYTVASALLVAIVAAHAGAVGLGQWQGDEYDYAASLRDQGVAYAIDRVTTHSPRPVSEFLVWLYLALVNTMRRPLIGGFLAFGWAVFLAGCCVRLMACAADRRLPRVFLALSVATLLLLGHPVAELFYWPMGMAAYLLTVTAMVVGTIQILDGGLETARGRIVTAVALLIAAGSSEVGAMVVLCFSALMLLAGLARLSRTQGHAWLILPFAAALGVLLAVTLGRGAGAPTIASEAGHHVLGSLRVAIPQMLRDIGVVDTNDGDWGQQGSGSLIDGIPIKLLVLAAFACFVRACFGRAQPAPVIVLIAALLFGMFGSIFAADFQFGFLCCQRHEAVRQCFMTLVLLATASLIAPARATPAMAAVGVACLALAMTPMMLWRLPNLVYAYRHMGVAASSLAATWESGLGPGQTAVFSEADGALAHAWSFPLGDHRASPTDGYDIRSAMRFFQKQELIVLPPPRIGGE
jgi:hypothetical protein